MSKKVIYLIFIALFVSAICGSCSRYNQAGYHGPNRAFARPHKEWKKPKTKKPRAKKKLGSLNFLPGVRERDSYIPYEQEWT